MADERYIVAPPSGADGWREVWAANRRYPPGRGGWLSQFFRSIFTRAAAQDLERQRDFNLVTLDLLADVRAHAEALKRELHSDFRRDIENLAGATSSALGAEAARLRDLTLLTAKRNDALIAALDQKVETVATRLRDAVNPVVPAVAPDVLYRRLEDALRGSEPQVRADVMHYVGLAAKNQPVLDAGCGRGEFLTACREAKIEARGVDTNERSVADLKQKGFDVTLAAIPDCFAGLSDASLGSILAMHVVEHLSVDALFALYREARRVLRPGGLLMMETPNAESILVSASDFWRDPTHLAPRHPAALTTLAREHGFEVAEIRAIHDVPRGAQIAVLESDPPELQRVVQALNERLFAPQDLRLVLRKEK